MKALVLMSREDFRARIEALRIPHLVLSEDCFYSCPRSGECCDEMAPPDHCTCGADAHNAKVDELLALLEAP